MNRSKMKFEYLNKTVGIQYPDKADSNCLEYVFTPSTEKNYTFHMREKFPDIWIDFDFNVGISSYFVYLSFDYSLDEKIVEEIITESNNYLDNFGYVWDEKAENNYDKFCKEKYFCENCPYNGLGNCESRFYEDYPELEDYIRKIDVDY